MATITYTYTLTNGTVADADQVMANLNAITTQANGNIDHTNILLSDNYTWTGTHTFNGGNLKIKGAGAGVASLQNANTATNRTITIPDPGADSTLVALAGAQSITGAKTFDGSALKIAGAGSGVSTFLNANTSTNSSQTLIYGAQTASSIVAAELLNTPGTVLNGSITVSGSTLTIKSGDGSTALSAGNPLYASINSTTSGVTKVVTFTANVAVTFGATSDTDGNLFGLTDLNWANSMPMFLGIIYDGATPYFCISRLPMYQSGSAAGSLCQLGDTDGDGDQDVMILTTGLTLANWVSKPITQVGWFNATYATTNSAWTFSVDSNTGFNDRCFSTPFNFPVAQMGAATSTYIYTNAGTAPIFTTNNYYYVMDKRGRVTCDLYLNGDGGTDGAGAVTTLIALPYKIYTPAASMVLDQSVGSVNSASTLSSGAPLILRFTDGGSNASFIYASAAATLTLITNAAFSNGARGVQGIFNFPAMGRIA